MWNDCQQCQSTQPSNPQTNQIKDADVENEGEATGFWSNRDGECGFTGLEGFHNFWISCLLCLESM